MKILGFTLGINLFDWVEELNHLMSIFFDVHSSFLTAQ